MGDSDKTVRCVICRAEFSDDEIEGHTSCPSCGDNGMPMSIAQDMSVKINWHELRILTIWADNYARLHKASTMPQTVAAIVKQLELQRPDGTYGPLTIMGELQELANHPELGQDIQVVEEDGTRSTVKKQESN